jgi:hypothetical protein
MKYMLMNVLFFCIVNMANAEVKAGGITIHKENTSLDKIFKDIEKQSGYCFFYNASLVQTTEKVTIQITNGTIQEVLVMCLQGLGLEHKMTGRIVTLKARAIDDKESSHTHYYFFPIIIPLGSRRVRKMLKKLIGKWLKKSGK